MSTAYYVRLILFTLLPATLILSSCEKVAPVIERVKIALDRDTLTEEVDVAPVIDIPPPPDPVAMEPVVNKDARVSILGYHDFTEGRSSNDMVLNIDDFREQLQSIKDAEIPVISMREFLDWKQGKGIIPEECMMITIDDGWKATHTLAKDVLKDFGYPFTIFLYKNYIGVGGRSMTHQEIRELAASGGTISSHSVSHNNMSKRGSRSIEDYSAWLKVELEESHQFLVDNFGDTGAIEKTFAFPYGIYNDQVLEMARDFGYEACFTVNGKKTPWDSDDMQIGRYVVHGTTLANFDPALSFGSGALPSSGRKLMTQSNSEDGETKSPLVTVKPPAESTIGNRLPLVEVDLSKLQGVQPDSISMRITGFGKVPHLYNSASGQVTYQIPQRLRLQSYSVRLSFRHTANPDTEVIAWEFGVDRLSDYLSPTVTKPGTNAPLENSSVDEKSANAGTTASNAGTSASL
tara:strand:+ start:663 stop:2048 length:1386 start_codon:yes stop_codon:yes gene_type:complete